MADHFLLKSSVPSDSCLPLAHGLALEAHGTLQALLTARIGAEAARLFAEPFVSRDKSGQTLHVAWYGPAGGAARPLADLDATTRRLAEDRLHVLLPQIEALAREPDLAPLIRAALTLSSPSDILTVDGLPVLVNWGIAGPGEGSALGGSVPGGSVPGGSVLGGYLQAGLSGAAPAPRPEPVPPVVPPAAAASVPPPAASSATGPQPAVLPPAALPRIAWVPLLCLLLLTGALLLWVLWPGTRIFPDQPAQAIDPATVDAAARAELDSLRARRDALQAALAGAQCRPDGQLVLPGDVSPEGLPVPAPGSPDLQSPDLQSPANVAPDAALAPAPDRVSVPGAGGEVSTLLAQLEASTVLILADGPESLSTGTGFAVAPGLIVTNRHVIEGVPPDRIFVANAGLGGVEQAEVLKSEGPLEETGRDFALLRIASDRVPALSLAAPVASQKLHHVVAAGFPGDVIETDSGFARLLQGDATAIPDLVVVDGTVNAHQEMPAGAGVLVHSAPLSSGNSGGPLVDLCGRVLGVNTFVRQGPMRTLNFAVSTQTLAAFLQGTPASVTVATEDCAPSVLPSAGLPTLPQAAPAPAGPDGASDAASGEVQP